MKQDRTVQELISSLKIERADILLIHTRRSLISWAIRFGTKSHWNHVALIYVIPQPPEYNNTFLIESAGHGVDIHHLRKYFGDLKRHDIGIKRLNADWFNSNQTLRLEMQRRVRGITLDQIDQEYDYNLLFRLALRAIRYLVFGGSQFLRRVIGRADKKIGLPRILQVKQFICSGFAQYAYFQSVREAVTKGTLPEQSLRDVTFDKDIERHFTSAPFSQLNQEDLKKELLSVIPKNIAGSDNLDWVYFIKEGKLTENPMSHEVPI